MSLLNSNIKDILVEGSCVFTSLLLCPDNHGNLFMTMKNKNWDEGSA